MRMPSVAGQFYPADRDGLDRLVASFMADGGEKENAIAIMSPHAGLVYSGAVAGAVYSRIKMPASFLLIGPNHTGFGNRVSIMSSGKWQIPTGVFAIDEKLSSDILKTVPLLSSDEQAHLYEHSLEVQLPFIAYYSTDIKIVPVTVMSATLQQMKTMGEGIANAVRNAGYPVVIAASSDMSHYVSDEVARRKDRMALERMLELDPEGLYETVIGHKISMCGYMPAVITLFAAKALGASNAAIVKYTTSGEVSGDFDHVVGYAGIVIK